MAFNFISNQRNVIKLQGANKHPLDREKLRS